MTDIGAKVGIAQINKISNNYLNSNLLFWEISIDHNSLLDTLDLEVIMDYGNHLSPSDCSAPSLPVT